MAKTIGIGVIGAGFGALVHIPGYRAVPGFEVVGVCSAPADHPQAVADRLGIPFACTDYRAIVGRPDVDLVSIAVPPHLHYDVAMAAIAAGKHVVCEKPIALNAAQARELAAAAKRAGVVNVVNHEFRYHPARAKLRELYLAGYLGRLYTVDLNIFSGGRASPEAPPWNWWCDRQHGGGALGAIISHWIDFFRWTFGEYAGVYGELDHFVAERLDPATGTHRPVTADDSSAWIARLESGGQIVAHFSSTARFGEGPRFSAVPVRVFGSAGTLMLDHQDRLWGARSGDAELRLLHEGDPETVQPTGKAGAGEASVLLLGLAPFKRLAARLYRAITEGEPVDPTFDDGVRVQDLMDAITLSQTERRWVRLPLDGEPPF